MRIELAGDHATVRSLQRCATPGYSEEQRKVLVLVLERTSGSWLIIEETAAN